MARVLFHPRRALILASLGEGAGTPAQLSQRLGQGIGPVAYHLRVLAAAGCIRPVESEGADAELAYEAVAPATRARARP